MSNLALYDEVENLDINQINVLTSKLLNIQVTRMSAEIKRMYDDQQLMSVELKDLKEENEKLQQDQQKVIEVATASMTLKQPKFEYVNQNYFGRCFGVSIGAKTIGKLFKTVGLAQKQIGTTTPYRQYIPRYAVTQAFDNYTDVKWQYENCVEFINNWLKENSLFEKFYSITTEREMENFINYMNQNY